jgi:pimeloyl-ACP methyl ester carboxylesterase
VPDQPGYNLSEVPKAVRDYGLDHLSEDVVALLDHFDHPEASLVGYGWGAAVTWVTAINFPDRISWLGILNLPHAGHDHLSA